MKKRVLLAAVFILLAISAAIWWASRQTAQARDKAECVSATDQEARLVRALKDPSGASCAALSDEVSRAVCTAWTTRDASKCPATQRQTCVPVAQRNPAACPAHDAWCLALASEDAEQCKKIASTGEQQDCRAWVIRDDSYISRTTDECADVARAQMAAKTNNPELCRGINDAQKKQSCIEALSLLR